VTHTSFAAQTVWDSQHHCTVLQCSVSQSALVRESLVRDSYIGAVCRGVLHLLRLRSFVIHIHHCRRLIMTEKDPTADDADLDSIEDENREPSPTAWRVHGK